MNVWEMGQNNAAGGGHHALCARLLDYPDWWLINWPVPQIPANYCAFVLPGVVLPEEYTYFPISGPLVYFPYGLRVEPDTRT